MSAQRMTLQRRKFPVRSPLRLAATIALLALPLGGCGTGALWDKFMAKDDTFVEEPAEGVFDVRVAVAPHEREDPCAKK